MGLWNSLEGTIQIRLISADLLGLLVVLQERGILLQQLEPEDDLQLTAWIPRRELNKLTKICNKRGDQLQILGKAGLFWTLCGLLRRPVLSIGILGILFLTIWAQGRVFFVFVEGNQSVPANLILEKASFCGIDFGVKRRDIRNEKLKNALMTQIPQLQWVGINTQGCVAVISVEEREIAQREEARHSVSSMVALQDAVIGEITVLEGTALCKVGDAVKQGQVLISGYTDCGLCIRAGNAKGEIYGETMHALTAVFPNTKLQRGEIQEESKKFSLILGKKRINLHNSSGISGGECVRIYSEQCVTLPGGFRLPIAIGVERVISYATSTTEIYPVEEENLTLLSNYLQSHMIAGQIRSSTYTAVRMEGYNRMDAVYQCYEMIGRVRPEECLQDYENYGTDG